MKTHDEKLAYIVDMLNRGNRVQDWPKDEREVYRRIRADSFMQANEALIRLRAEKILRACS